MDQLRQSVSEILYQAGYSEVQVSITETNELIIHADITMDKRWKEVQRRLAELPGLNHWRVENSHQEQSDVIISALIHNGLADKLNVTLIEQRVVISGVLTAEQKLILQNMIASLKLQYPSLDLLYQNVPISDEGKIHLPSAVTGFVDGRYGQYVVLTNGDRLHLGSRLPDGSEVVALSANAIGMKYHHSLINYPFHF